MRRGSRAIVAACAIACAVVACDGSSRRGGFPEFPPPFPQGFLPVVLGGTGDSGDVHFRSDGDLMAVSGSAAITRIARADGAVSDLATDVGGASTVLLSLVEDGQGRVFAGDDAGNVWRVDAAGVSTLLAATGADPVTGLAIAPTGFGATEGHVVAALGPGGIVTIDPGAASPAPVVLAAGDFADIAFGPNDFFALDAAAAEIVTVTPAGTVTLFADGFAAPVGLTVDGVSRQLLVADAGDGGLLRNVPLTGGTPTDLAPYPFDATPPSGLAFDGIATLAFVTPGSVTVRAALVPPVDPAFFGFVVGEPRVGYGDIERDRLGNFVAAGNDPDGSDGTLGNIVFRLHRTPPPELMARNIGAPGEDLLGLAVDPVSQKVYLGSGLGNVWTLDAGGGVTLLAAPTAPTVAVLGLELAPPSFGALGGRLVATSSDGRVFAIDPASPCDPCAPFATITTAGLGNPARLPDLVFSTGGTLYVLDHGGPGAGEVPRVLTVTPAGAVANLGADFAGLGLPDGIEIDEGGDRLLVLTADDAAGDRLLEIDLSVAPNPPVALLAVVDIDEGFFPSGIAYDLLGGVVFRAGNNLTRIDALRIFPPSP